VTVSSYTWPYKTDTFFFPNRATTESNGQDPEFGEQTFDIRVHVRDAFPKSLQIHHK
jgi:hypothetical protein